MKLRLRLTKKAAVISAAVFLSIVSVGTGAGIYLGFVPNPVALVLGQDPSQEGGHEADPTAHDQAATENHHEPSEEVALAKDEPALAHGESSDGHGDRAAEAQAQLVETQYELPPRSELVTAVKQLLKVQTDAAFGLPGESGTQRDMINQARSSIAKLEPKKLTKQEYEALAVYLLSGGSPNGLGDLIKNVPTEYHLEGVLAGIRAYVIGDIEKAQELLMVLDARSFSAPLASRLLLAQATLMPLEKAAEQKRALELAASLVPGTLVEEAAYRRLLSSALRTSNLKSFSHYTSSYTRRFPKSAYISEFIVTFQEGVVLFEQARTPVPFDIQRRVVRVLPSDMAGKLLAQLGRKAVDAAYIDLCKFVTGDEFDDVHLSNNLVQQMKLYELACGVVEDPEHALAELSSLSTKDFEENDSRLLSDALRLANALIGNDKIGAQKDYSGPPRPDQTTAATLVSATQQLSDSEELIEEALR